MREAKGVWFTMRGKVTRVVDGDTLNVRIGNRTERVRVIGIDSPERGDCYWAQATALLRTLAGNKRVTLSGDRTQTRRDRFGRLLAYVRLPNGQDAGVRMLAGGSASVLVVGRPFTRHARYVATENAAKRAGAGIWSRCGLANAADYSILSLTDTPDPLTAGADLTYRIVVSNAGPAVTSSLAVVSQTLATDAAAGMLLIVDGQAPRGCGLAGPVHQCLLPDLAAGGTADVVIVVRPLDTPRGRSSTRAVRTKGTADTWKPVDQIWVALRPYRSGRGFYPWPNTARYCGLL
jgi:endonuclease YncB( thermonuclease family)